MRTNRNTPSQFIAEHLKWRAALGWGLFVLFWLAIATIPAREGMVIGVVIILITGVLLPAAIALFSAERSQIILDRASGKVELRRRSIMGYEKLWFDLAHVTGAKVDYAIIKSGKTGRRRRSNHTVMLEVGSGMDAGRYPFTYSGVPAKQAYATAKALNKWLALDSDPPQA